ncbi:MAG: leucine-rich repeat protein, partial [Paludibacteraceae bacterium]
MQYPLISEYVAAIREAEGNLDSLSNLRPVLDSHGEPFRSSGAFAIVFKMKDPQSGKCFALKCFTEDQAGRAEAYRLIAEELESVDSPYLTSVRYLEKELFVDCNCGESEFPVLVMDWVEGKTMEAYIAEHYADSDCMAMLCFRFAKMAAWLRAQPFAHGDIKPDNILVKADGSLILVDYDGMFIPAMKGQPSPTMGTRDFSHPLRKADDFDETIDDFSLASILLSLKAIALCPRLYEEYAAADRLLFSATDYLDLSQCKAMAALHGLMADGELNRMLALFLLAHAQKNLAATSFRLFNMAKPKIEEKLSTNVTDEDRNEAIEDSFGAKYSKDGKRLLKVPCGLKGVYSIREGTKVVCDYAFSGCSGLTSIHIPDGVTSIGDWAFDECSGLKNIHIPDGVTSIGRYAFSGCCGLTNIHIPDGVTSIGDRAFSGCRGLTSIYLGSRVKEMGANPFGGVICNIENHSPYFEVEDQVLYTKGK